MDVVVLAAKSALAVLLLIAGGAKLSDLPTFAGALRMFVPRRSWFPALRVCAAIIAAAELTLGAASLSLPRVAWLNLAVLAMACSFAVVAVAGYILFRGRSCQCFGSLSRRRFDLLGILRSGALVAMAAVATGGVPAASVQIGIPASLALVCAAGLLALAAFTAARALDVSSSNLRRG